MSKRSFIASMFGLLALGGAATALATATGGAAPKTLSDCASCCADACVACCGEACDACCGEGCAECCPAEACDTKQVEAAACGAGACCAK